MEWVAWELTLAFSSRWEVLVVGARCHPGRGSEGCTEVEERSDTKQRWGGDCSETCGFPSSPMNPLQMLPCKPGCWMGLGK